LVPTTALAHKPFFGEDALDQPERAYVVADPAASIVVYRSVTCEHPELWMKLEGTQDFRLFVQLLKPQIDRLTDYKPSLALVGPGLAMPEAEIGIEIPDGMGASVFPTDAVKPVAFDEPFTNTHDWILVEETIKLPTTGTFYVVAWDPGHRTGKLAVAVGTVESFGAADLANAAEWTRKTRSFHETPDYPPATAPMEMVCDAGQGDAGEVDAGPVDAHPDDNADASTSSARTPSTRDAGVDGRAGSSDGGEGCTVSASRSAGRGWWALAALLLLARRAKRRARTVAR
jgi:hypothetical protein